MKKKKKKEKPVLNPWQNIFCIAPATRHFIILMTQHHLFDKNERMLTIWL